MLRPLGELFDPRVPALSEILGPSHFPGGAFGKDPVLLDAMAALGLIGQTVTLKVLAQAAAAVQAAFQQLPQELQSHLSTASVAAAAGGVVGTASTGAPGAATTQQRGAEGGHDTTAGLSIMGSAPQQTRSSLPAAVDPAVGVILARARALLKHLDAWASANTRAAASAHEENGALWRALQSTVWCPVLGEAPAQGMPWPASQPLLAPPRLTRPRTGVLIGRVCCSVWGCGLGGSARRIWGLQSKNSFEAVAQKGPL